MPFEDSPAVRRDSTSVPRPLYVESAGIGLDVRAGPWLVEIAIRAGGFVFRLDDLLSTQAIARGALSAEANLLGLATYRDPEL